VEENTWQKDIDYGDDAEPEPELATRVVSFKMPLAAIAEIDKKIIPEIDFVALKKSKEELGISSVNI
jgi:hypothetical protein